MLSPSYETCMDPKNKRKNLIGPYQMPGHGGLLGWFFYFYIFYNQNIEKSTL